MELAVLTGEDVRNDALATVDLVVLPGGSGSAYDSLGETGRAKFVAYLRNGGRCLATGSGATLLALPTNETDKCLGVIPYKSAGSLGHRLSLAPSVTAADGSVQLVANFCDHKWGDWSDTLEPTFLKKGARRRVCSVCGATSSEPTARLTVPSGYKAALYVEGNENQYIYTGITIQDRITADLTFAFTKVGRISYMLGAWDKTGSNMREYLCNINASNTWRGSIADEGLTEFTDLPKAKVGATNHTVTVVNGPEFSFALNGQTATKTYSTSVTPRNRELVLMAYNEAGSVLCKSDAKLFEAKIYTNLTVLARHYLPVYQESSQTYGLWDAVNGTFKKSSGSAFLGELAPPENPTVNGEPVEPGKVFERATSAKPTSRTRRRRMRQGVSTACSRRMRPNGIEGADKRRFP